MWYIQTVEYYSGIKKNEIMPFAAIWRDLDLITLSERSQKEKDMYHMMTSLVAQTVKCLSTMRETWVRSLSREDSLEKEMATHSSTLAWKILWIEEPGRLPSMGLDPTERFHFQCTNTICTSWKYLYLSIHEGSFFLFASVLLRLYISQVYTLFHIRQIIRWFIQSIPIKTQITYFIKYIW